MTDDDFPDALPAGHRLHWYVLERVLGQGGFGITYLAHDSNLDRRVAIKEYLPAEVARRRSDASARPRTESHAERFAWGLERFLAEARTLARFDHPNIVRVLSIFEANNTAYMVMRFEEGEDLGTLLERAGTLPEQELMSCLLPILEGLQLVHTSGFIHRDIKPENIYVREDGSPVLLDFGSARQSFGSAKTMTILVAPGYAPLEQYYGDARTQGPWTDIYGLGATCYRAIAGRAPLDAIARAKGVLGSTRDLLEPATAVARGRYDARLLAAIDHSLQLSERDRPQSIVEWRREIRGSSLSEAATAAVSSPSPSLSAEPRDPANVAQASFTSEADRPRRSPTALQRAPVRAGLAWGVATATCVAVLGWLAFGGGRSGTETATVSPAPAPVIATVQQQPVGAPAVSHEPAPAFVGSPASNAEVGPLTANAEPTRREVPLREATPREVPREAASRAPPVREVAVRDARAAASRASTVVTLAEPATRPITTPAATTTAAPSPAASLAAAPPTSVAAATVSPTRRRDEELDAAEAALRGGDAARAGQLAEPWADAGVPRAQTLFGRAQEARSKDQRNDFQAYLWYSIAARNGEPSAQTLRDKVAGRMQPAEIRQADKLIEGWKPRPEPRLGSDRNTP